MILLVKTGIMEGLHYWCLHMIITSLGSVMARYVEKLVWGWYAKMCGLRWVSTWCMGGDYQSLCCRMRVVRALGSMCASIMA